jgi:phosphoglycerate dehydrogenase-like enzyme
LLNPSRPRVDAQSTQAQEAARALGLPLHILKASSEHDFDTVFLTLVQLRAGALAIAADALFADRRDQIVALARRYPVPVMYELHEFAAAGGLISYGASSSDAHAGRWDKSAADSHEIRGKTLGIVGYGNIGSQLSTLAEAMGMRVIYFDLTDKLRHGNTEPAESLTELLRKSDVVSLHVPETAATQRMIGAAEIAAMKAGSYLINNSRGTVVDLEALAGALRSGHLRGAAVDVFSVAG